MNLKHSGLPLYDCRSSRDVYITQLEMLAQLNHWTKVEKVMLEKTYQEKLPQIFSITEVVHLLELC